MPIKNVVNKKVSRRTFLKAFGAVAAFFSLGGLTSLFSKDEKVLVENVNTGAGYGVSKYGR